MPEARTATTIAVRLTLFADLRRFEPKGLDGARTFTLSARATVAGLMAEAGIPAGEEVTVGLNGERGTRESVLHDGDDVVLFSPMEGG